MAYKTCLLGFTKDFAKDPAQPGQPSPGEVTVTSNVQLLIPEEVADHFNIPTVELSGLKETLVQAYSFSGYKSFSDTTGTTVQVPEHGTTAGGVRRGGRVVRLPHATLKTSKNRPRTCSIRFPSFFTIVMIGQALGQMLKANAPNSWKLDAGRTYPLVVTTATGILPGCYSGAWVISALAASSNTGDTGEVGDLTIVKSGGKTAKASS